MTIILTNDDGIDAPGIQALLKAVYYVGEYGKRDRTPGSDVDVCFSGNIAVTQLRV